MFCENCGSKLDDGVVFCPNCGEKIEYEDTEKTEIIMDVSSDDVIINDVDEPAVSEPEISEPEAVENEKPEPEENTSPKEETPEADNSNMPVKWEAPNTSVGAYTGNVIFCHSCGAKNVKGDLFCQSCGKSLTGDDPVGKKTDFGKVLKIAGIAVAAFAVVLIGFLVISTVFKGKNRIFYVKDTDILISDFKGKDIKRGAGDVFSSKNDNTYYYGLIQVSKDNNYLFCPKEYSQYGSGSYELCYTKLNGKADMKKLDSDVESYQVLDNNKVVYIKDNDSLYVHTLKDREKVASDVRTWYISEDQKQILWLDQEGRLYVQDISLKKDKVKLESDVSYLQEWSANFEYILYVSEENLYVMKNLKEREKLISDYTGNAAVFADKNGYDVYYSEAQSQTVRIMDFITDDMKQTDQAIQEPDIRNYQHEVTKPSFWGPSTTIETDDQYYTLLDQYYEKAERDEWREYFEEEELELENTTIYHYTNGGKEEVKSDILSGAFDKIYSTGEDQVILCGSVNTNDVSKIKFSEAVSSGNYYSIEEDIRNQIYGNITYFLICNGKCYDVDIDNIDEIYYTACSEKQEVYVLTSEDEGFGLYAVSYGNNIGSSNKIDKDINAIMDVTSRHVYYLKDDSENKLYCDGEMVEKDVHMGSFSELADGKGLVFYTDYNNSSYEGTLNIAHGASSEEIVDDVYGFYVFESGQIALLVDYSVSSKTADLLMYDGKRIKKIDTDVAGIIPID